MDKWYILPKKISESRGNFELKMREFIEDFQIDELRIKHTKYDDL